MSRPPPTSLVILTAALAVLLLATKGCGNGTASKRLGEYDPTRRELPAIAKHIRIEAPREIAPNQLITVLHIPDPLVQAPALEQRCLLYEHLEYRTSQLVCSSFR